MLTALWLAALAPLLFLVVFRPKAPASHWLVALGFSVSVFADFGAKMLGGSWALTYVYPAVQLGLFAWAFGAPWAMLALLTLALVQVAGMPLSGPEMWVTVLGSMVVIWLAMGHPLFGSMLAYCGLATCFYLLLATELFRPAFMPLWYAYQGSRLLAFGLFIGIAHREAARA